MRPAEDQTRGQLGQALALRAPCVRACPSALATGLGGVATGPARLPHHGRCLSRLAARLAVRARACVRVRARLWPVCQW